MVSFFFIPRPGQSNVMMLCCQNRRSKNPLFPTFPLWQKWVGGPWWESMFVYNWELHWKIVDWDTLDQHYGVIIATIITENYRLPLNSGHLLGYRRSPQMKPDPVHWGEQGTHLGTGCQGELQTGNAKSRDSLGAPWVQRYLSPCYKFGRGKI